MRTHISRWMNFIISKFERLCICSSSSCEIDWDRKFYSNCSRMHIAHTRVHRNRNTAFIVCVAACRIAKPQKRTKDLPNRIHIVCSFVCFGSRFSRQNFQFNEILCVHCFERSVQHILWEYDNDDCCKTTTAKPNRQPCRTCLNSSRHKNQSIRSKW